LVCYAATAIVEDVEPLGVLIGALFASMFYTMAREIHLRYHAIDPLVRENGRLRSEVQRLADQVSALTREQA